MTFPSELPVRRVFAFDCYCCRDRWIGPWVFCADGRVLCETCSEGDDEQRNEQRELVAIALATTQAAACLIGKRTAAGLDRWLTWDRCRRLLIAAELAQEVWAEQQRNVIVRAHSADVGLTRELEQAVRPPWVLGVARRCLGARAD